MPRSVQLVVHWSSFNRATRSYTYARTGARELNFQAGESLYDILVRILPATRWTEVWASWEVRQTKRLADGSTHTNLKPDFKCYYDQPNYDNHNIRRAVLTLQTEIQASQSDYTINITDGQIVRV